MPDKPKPRKMRKTLREGDEVALVIPRGRKECPVEVQFQRRRTTQRLVLVIPRAKVGCDA